MNKEQFEQDIENKTHEYLYIKDNTKIIYQKESYGCLKKSNSYTIYYINEDEIFIFLGIFNNEYDAYEYLKEIMDYIHNIQIEIILDDYFNKHINKEIIKTYMYTDNKLEEEFHKRLENKVKKRGSYERNSKKINRKK